MATLAGPPTDECLRAVQHEGTPRGKTVTISGIETYLAEPIKSGGAKRVVLYLPDIWGPFFVNNKLIMDYFADQGFTVLGPDYFFGDYMADHMKDPDWDRAAWRTKTVTKAKERMPAWYEDVRKIYGSPGDTKYCAVGYCFGAPFTLDLAATDSICGAATAHPSSLNEEHFTKTKKPILFCCAETDNAFPPDKRRRAEDILVEQKAMYQFMVFSGVSHGYAVKGDPNVEVQRWAKEETARAMAAWFDRCSKL